MYAVIVTGGKQYKVENGDVIYVEKLDAEENAEVTFDKVLAIGAVDGIKVGSPYVKGATVAAKVLKTGKGKKITVFTYKPKKNEKRKKGHRQPYTMVEIIEVGGERAPEKEEPAEEVAEEAAVAEEAVETAAEEA